MLCNASGLPLALHSINQRGSVYQFSSTNHPIILTHAVLVGLTPLIPLPVVDDWVKGIFLRSMVRQLAAARGVSPTPAQVDALIQEDFWDSCIEGCFGTLLYLLREVLSKIFFFVEWRRAINLVGYVYYTGFLIDAALQDGYPLARPDGSTEPAASLREAVRRARYQANLRLFQHLVRENIRPLAFLRAGWLLAGRTLASLPRMLVSLPRVIWRGVRRVPGQAARGVAQGARSFWSGLRSAPRRAVNSLVQGFQVLLGRQQPPEMHLVERIVQSLQAAVEKMDSRHFDELHARLVAELNPQ
jgi:hypothetical protein